MTTEEQLIESEPWPVGPVSPATLRDHVERGEITTVSLAVPDIQGRPKVSPQDRSHPSRRYLKIKDAIGSATKGLRIARKPSPPSSPPAGATGSTRSGRAPTSYPPTTTRRPQKGRAQRFQ